MYKFIAYIPESALSSVKTAMFEAGAGRDGNYDCCAWQTLGVGQFRPLAGANPAIGQVGKMSEVAEWRVEMMVHPDRLHEVVSAYKQAHPYEVPAYEVYQMIDVD